MEHKHTKDDYDFIYNLLKKYRDAYFYTKRRLDNSYTILKMGDKTIHELNQIIAEKQKQIIAVEKNADYWYEKYIEVGADGAKKYQHSKSPKLSLPEIKSVKYNEPETIVFWSDGTKTVVKAYKEAFDAEKGLAMAIAKKAMGNKRDYYDTLKKFTDDTCDNISRIASVFHCSKCGYFNNRIAIDYYSVKRCPRCKRKIVTR